MSQPAVVDARKAFTERANRSHLLEYWAVGYRTNVPETGVLPYVWKWDEMKALMVEAGHIVLVRSDPRDIPRIISLSRATYRKMVQNLWWAAGYNIFAIPLAAGVLAAQGILLTPALGAVLMSASTIVVALNAQLLKRAKL